MQGRKRALKHEYHLNGCLVLQLNPRLHFLGPMLTGLSHATDEIHGVGKVLSHYGGLPGLVLAPFSDHFENIQNMIENISWE